MKPKLNYLVSCYGYCNSALYHLLHAYMGSVSKQRRMQTHKRTQEVLPLAHEMMSN